MHRGLCHSSGGTARRGIGRPRLAVAAPCEGVSRRHHRGTGTRQRALLAIVPVAVTSTTFMATAGPSAACKTRSSCSVRLICSARPAARATGCRTPTNMATTPSLATARAPLADKRSAPCLNARRAGDKALHAIVRFEYPDDLLDSEGAKFVGREQDLFTWFSLVGRCPRCSQALLVADFECA